MARTANHMENEETFDSSSPPESKRASRSKHSETEQRRRSKINERFQILRGLIPENDQKRDKASFLLEVIQYIQYLQEKLQMYEGLGQGWTGEPTKLTPWVARNNFGPVESFGHQSHLERLMSAAANDIISNPSLLCNAQESTESDFAGVAFSKRIDNATMFTGQGVSSSMLFEPPVFEAFTNQHSHGSLAGVEQHTRLAKSHFWGGRSCPDNGSLPAYSSEKEQLRSEGDQPSISRIYSHALLNSLTSTFQSSGVDMSQTMISMQLDIRKGANVGSTSSVFSIRGDQSPSGGSNPVASVDFMENYQHPRKRLRSDHC